AGPRRPSMDPEHLLGVGVLDVNDTEARTLLLAIAPLAQLAEYEATTLSELRALVEPNSAAVRQLWDAISNASASVNETLEKARQQTHEDVLPEQFLVLVECA